MFTWKFDIMQRCHCKFVIKVMILQYNAMRNHLVMNRTGTK